MPERPRAILILGGTREASNLAEQLCRREGLRVVSSLAGRTMKPLTGAGEWRIGGFGGVEGLATFLRDEGIDTVIDATHPFAETMSLHAVEAASRIGISLLTLLRPAWERRTDDRWVEVGGLNEAALAVPEGGRAFLALGSQHIGAFAERADAHFIVRMVDRPRQAPPLASCELVIGRPGDTVADEIELFRSRSVTCIVSRNSGGGSYEKIQAARELGIPVIMIARPVPQPGATFATVDALLSAID
ncbi:cobalt-precorrin-6A reductase [Hoeflea sp. WL0058]|uniref:Cobalt-precorrin-6A reductase n=1 Tax=Flavimaribacter sediminis TaxID=2865987 RepID=A0AAE2ZKH4_9HYPH|nr:cobalt-precorrin-6A reductase [Flavimaribacter sediminis]MBW8635998.1 cobalt-precorrin-6A reductase [Flavimaribacter sediminis]